MQDIESKLNELGIQNSAYWINTLKTIPMHQTGVIKCSGKVLHPNNIPLLTAELSYLANQGFYLPVVFGGGVMYDAIASKIKKVDGIRYTSKKFLKQIIGIAETNLTMMADNLKEHGIESYIVPFKDIITKPHIGKKTGYTGDVLSFNTKELVKAIYEKKVPLVPHIGIYENQAYNINSASVASALAKTLGSKKLILLGNTPIYDSSKDKKIIKKISSEYQLEKLIHDKIITDGAITNCQEAYKLLNYLGPGHCVQITSLIYDKDELKSSGILEELLGNGTGTQIIVPPKVTSYPMHVINEDELIELINGSFKEKVLVDGYFDMIKEKNPTFYLDDNVNGCAITYKMTPEVSYMCKIATRKDYEGIGIGNEIMNTIMLQEKSFTWRCDPKNACAVKMYDRFIEENDGLADYNGKYIVYAVGLTGAKFKGLVPKVLDMPVTLVEK